MIDNKMLELAQQFIKEEFLILCYAKGNDIPEQVAKDELHAEQVGQLKAKLYDIERNLNVSSYRLSEQDSSI